MAKKKRSFDPRSLEEVLQEITAERNLAKGLNALRIKQLWVETVGKHVMQYTLDLQLRGSTLHVKLTSAPLREELSYGKEKILKHINNALGYEGIQKIILR